MICLGKKDSTPPPLKSVNTIGNISEKVNGTVITMIKNIQEVKLQ